MKLRKIFLLSMLFFSFQVNFGQEKNEAVLIDEFSKAPCDEFISRTDRFLTDLQDNPNSQGYAVISGRNDDLRGKVGFELLLKGAIYSRNIEHNRITLIRGAEEQDFRIQFWRVPSEAKKPDFKESKWNFVFSPKSRPFKFYDNAGDDICPLTPFEKVYAEYLNANPQARGHIVIFTKSFKQYEKLKNDARSLLKYISSNRLRFFHVRRNHSDNYADTEYWLVPKK